MLEYLKVLVWPIVIVFAVLLLRSQLRDLAGQMARRLANLSEVTGMGWTAKFDSIISTVAIQAESRDNIPSTPSTIRGQDLRRLQLALRSDPGLPPQPPAIPPSLVPQPRLLSVLRPKNEAAAQDSATDLLLYKERIAAYLHSVAKHIYNATTTDDDSTGILRAISRTPLAQDQWRDLVEASILLETQVAERSVNLWVVEVNQSLVAASRLRSLCKTSADLVEQTVEQARSMIESGLSERPNRASSSDSANPDPRHAEQ